jgi:hypothetical protein
MEAIESALKEAEKVAKRQRACASKASDCLDKLILEVTEARKQLSAPGAGVSDVLKDLNDRLSRADPAKDIVEVTKELHGAVNKLGKVNVDPIWPLKVCCSLLCVPRSIVQSQLSQRFPRPEMDQFTSRQWTKPLYRTCVLHYAPLKWT